MVKRIVYSQLDPKDVSCQHPHLYALLESSSLSPIAVKLWIYRAKAFLKIFNRGWRLVDVRECASQMVPALIAPYIHKDAMVVIEFSKIISDTEIEPFFEKIETNEYTELGKNSVYWDSVEGGCTPWENFDQSSVLVVHHDFTTLYLLRQI